MRRVSHRTGQVSQTTWKLIEPTKPISAESPTDSILTTVQDAIEALLAKCHNRNIAPNTLAKYKTFTNQLATYCQHRGYVHIGPLTVGDMDRFYASWKDGIRPKAKKRERLKAFVKFGLKRDWIGKDTTEDLQAPEVSSITVPKSPFTDEELKRIYEACDTTSRPVPTRSARQITWHHSAAAMRPPPSLESRTKPKLAA